MFTGAAAAGITAAGNAIGQFVNNAANKKAVKLQNQYNMEMWNRTNEYNHPLAQMERLKQAGLNPHLVYGSSANTGNASSIPEYQSYAPQYDFEAPFRSLMSSIAAIQDMRQKDVTRDLTLAQVSKTWAENTVQQAMAEYQDLKNVNQSLQNDFDSATLQFRIDKEKYGSRVAFNNWQQSISNLAKTNAEIRKINSEIIKNNIQGALWNSQRRLNNQSWMFNEEMNPKLLTRQDLLNTGYGYDNFWNYYGLTGSNPIAMSMRMVGRFGSDYLYPKLNGLIRKAGDWIDNINFPTLPKLPNFKGKFKPGSIGNFLTGGLPSMYFE